MKSGVVIILVAVVSYACMSNAKEAVHFNVKQSDSISEMAKEYLHEQEIRIEQKDIDLLDDLHSIRDSNERTIVEVREVPCVVTKVESVHDTIYVPIYKKVVYSINTPRAYQVGLDTCVCSY